MSLCSRAQRPAGVMGSSGRAECRRSETVLRRVEELGFDGMKKTLLLRLLVGFLLFLVRMEERNYPVIGILVLF